MTNSASLDTAPPLPLAFPFAAIAGQPQLRQALLLAAVDPGLGGVLIEGPRGTAKSTAARALAELLPGAPFVTLPLGASLDHLVGTLDLGRALAGHEVRFAPGLLARAHGGVLYVDEVNLLPDALIDSLLDVAASGVNHVERDGISRRHAARFVLVGTMNPEEGELRPQLLDRFGLCVRLRNLDDAAARQAVVRARLAFDADPVGFRAGHAQAQEALAATLRRARDKVADREALPYGDAVHDAVGALCMAARVDGLRADLVMLRAARALAAWEDAGAIDVAHVRRVSALVLAHRGVPGAVTDEELSAPSPSSESSSQPRSQQPPGSKSRQPEPERAPDSPQDTDGGRPTGAGTLPKAGAGDPSDARDEPGMRGRSDASDAPDRPAPPSDATDWGALAPEPVGIERVKPLRPLLPGTAAKGIAKKV